MITTRVIQGSFLGGRPKLASVQPRVAPPPIQAKLAARPPVTAIAGRLPGPPMPARSPGAPAPAFAARAGAVQRQGAGGAFAVEAGVLGLAAGGGRELPEALRGKMEAALGADFSAVRVHVGPQAERIGAIAFTLGSDIYFAPGRYQPETAHGQQLLGHELAHVVQQRAGRVKNPLGAGLAVVQDHALEAEADRLGQRAAAYRLGIQAKTASSVLPPASAVRVSPPVAAGPGRYRLTAGASGRAVGSVMVQARDTGAVEITDLQVSEAERGRGIGQMLLASAARTGRQFGKSKVTLAAQDSGSGHLTQWYKGMGFAQTGVNRRGYPQLEAPIGRVLAGAAAQPNLPHRGPPPPLTAFGSPSLRPAAASRTALPPNPPRVPPGIQARMAPFRAAVVQRSLSGLDPNLQLLIASYLDLHDLNSLGLVSHQFHDITSDERIRVPAVAHFLDTLENRYPEGDAPTSADERRRWERGTRRGQRGALRPTRGARSELPFVLKLSMPGSGNLLWRTKKWSDSWSLEKKRTLKTGQSKLNRGESVPLLISQHPDKIRANEIPLAEEGGEIQQIFHHVKKYEPDNRISKNREIAVFTIAGPMGKLGPGFPEGTSDSGPNKIACNVDLATGLIEQFVRDCELKNADRPMLIKIKAHSRNAVALDMAIERISEKYQHKYLTFDLIFFDPVPGPGQSQEYYLGKPLTVERSTLVISVDSEKDLTDAFRPRRMRGARRIIISQKNHGVGYHIGFRFRNEDYRGNKLNQLPPGVYVSVGQILSEGEPEIIERCHKAEDIGIFLTKIYRGLFRSKIEGYKKVPLDLESREDAIIEAARAWFAAEAEPEAESRRDVETGDYSAPRIGRRGATERIDLEASGRFRRRPFAVRQSSEP